MTVLDDGRTSRIAKPKPVRARKAATTPPVQPTAPAPVSPAFRPIATRRISEEISSRIRSQIASGALKPGDSLPSEREMSALFAVSRMAVREGMRTLETSGLITLRKGRHGGAFVSDDSARLVTQSIRDMVDLGRASLVMLMEARIHIMDGVVRLACENATAADFAALAANLEETETLTRQGRFEERTFKSIEFNKLLATATRNQILCAIVEALSDVVRHFVIQAGPRPHDKLLTSRRKLLAEIRARQADVAASTMRMHLVGLQKHLVRAAAEAPAKSRPTRT